MPQPKTFTQDHVLFDLSLDVMDSERQISRLEEKPDNMNAKEFNAIKRSHKYLTDDEYQEIKDKAVSNKEPLTRNQLYTKGRRLHKAKKRLENIERRQKLETTPPSTYFHLHHGDFSELLNHGLIEDNSLDFIITDPPYDKESIPLFYGLAEFSRWALKPGGSLLCLGGTMWWREQLAEMERASEGFDLKFWWMLTYHMTDRVQKASQIFPRRVYVKWKPIFWFVNGDYTGEWVPDTFVCPPQTEETKQYHEWGQHVKPFIDILEAFAFPGQLVCDPFVGGGTTAVAAVHRGCGFIGADINADAIETTAQRIEQLMEENDD